MRTQSANPSEDSKRQRGVAAEHPVSLRDAFVAGVGPILAKLASSHQAPVMPHPQAAAMVADSEAGPLFKRLPNFMLNAGIRVTSPSSPPLPTYTAAVAHSCLQWYTQAEDTIIPARLTLSCDLKNAVAVLTVRLDLALSVAARSDLLLLRCSAFAKPFSHSISLNSARPSLVTFGHRSRGLEPCNGYEPSRLSLQVLV